MDARARQAQDHVAGADVSGIEHLGAIDDAHGEAGQIVVVRAHDAGVLGHLAAHERAARQLAAVGHAFHDLRHVLGLDVPDGHVIQEEQRLGAGGQDVVHAHGHQVLAHRLVTVQQLGEHELGAYAIRARDEDGILHVLQRGGGEEPAEAADTAHNLGTVGCGNHLLDGVHRAAALGGVHAGVLVRHMLGRIAGAHVPALSRGRADSCPYCKRDATLIPLSAISQISLSFERYLRVSSGTYSPGCSSSQVRSRSFSTTTSPGSDSWAVRLTGR